VVAGAKLIIITWNVVGFQLLPRDVRGRLEEDIIDAYKSARDHLQLLRGRRLENLDLNDEVLSQAIKNVFQIFSSKESIKSTGASKILHLLNPHIFMMWDERIRKAYHVLHTGHNLNNVAECYLQFLKQSQEIVREVLRGMSEDEIWSRHLEFLDRVFFETFAFRESILKMLDGCNYVRFSKR
jgi:hypothetical protein